MASWAMVRRMPHLTLALALLASAAAQERPMCQLGDTFTASVDMHLGDWDKQIAFGLNESLNCSEFLEYVYLSRDRIRAQLDYVRGNFTAEDDAFRAQGGSGGSTSWAMTHMSGAASLLSAHIHIHGVLSAARSECLNEHLQLLFLMSLKRLKTLMHTQMRHLWLVFQGTAELVRQGAGRWLSEVVDLFEADLRTFESIMVNWRSAEELIELANGSAVPARPGPPLPPFSPRESDGVSMSTIEVLRRDSFEEWNLPKPLLRALLRYVFPRDSHVADFCAGGGAAASFLNETGLVQVYAFDASTNIKLLSKNVVDFLRVHMEPVNLWMTFDISMCISSGADFGSDADAWTQAWKNIGPHTKRAAILSCGSGEVRRQALSAAATYAPELQLDEQLSAQLDEGQELGLCIFWRRQTQ